MAALFVFSITLWLGWLLWAGLLCLPGMRHPKVHDLQPVSPGILLLAPAALVVLLLTATAEPFTHFSLLDVIARMRH